MSGKDEGAVHGGIRRNGFAQGVLPISGTIAVQPVDDAVSTPFDKVNIMPTDMLGREYETFRVPEPLQQHGPARIIAMCNQKGGVGKTTSSINIAGALSQYGRRVLIVDFDPQGAATVGLGVNANTVENTVYTALFNDSIDVHEVIQHTEFENIDVMPANIDLSAAEVQLVTEVGREQVLAGVLRKVRNEYDVIIIDCQPSLGLLTVNALTAADGVIIPDAVHRKSAVAYQSRAGSVWCAGHDVHAHPALRRSAAAYLRSVPGQGLPFGYFAFHKASGFHGCRSSDNHICPRA